MKPKMKITMLELPKYSLGEVETNKATVPHRRIRQSMPKMIWVGPGVHAKVTFMTKTLVSIPGHVLSLRKERHKAWV